MCTPAYLKLPTCKYPLCVRIAKYSIKWPNVTNPIMAGFIGNGLTTLTTPNCKNYIFFALPQVKLLNKLGFHTNKFNFLWKDRGCEAVYQLSVLRKMT